MDIFKGKENRVKAMKKFRLIDILFDVTEALQKIIVLSVKSFLATYLTHFSYQKSVFDGPILRNWIYFKEPVFFIDFLKNKPQFLKI